MPKTKNGGDRVYLQNAVKTLATNIRFASVDNPVHTIAITSSVPNEGKSTIAIELSKAMASGNKRVLLIECDMRRRSLADIVGARARHGIYAVLSGQVELDEALVATSHRNLFFLDSEPHIPNPADILSSQRFRKLVAQMESDFDYVVIDTPPVGTFVDAAIIAAPGYVAEPATTSTEPREYLLMFIGKGSKKSIKSAGSRVTSAGKNTENCTDWSAPPWKWLRWPNTKR